jgi:hypothetical protein
MAAFVIRAIDQHTPHSAGAHFAKRDFLGAHGPMIPQPALRRKLSIDCGW